MVILILYTKLKLYVTRLCKYNIYIYIIVSIITIFIFYYNVKKNAQTLIIFIIYLSLRAIGGAIELNKRQKSLRPPGTVYGVLTYII